MTANLINKLKRTPQSLRRLRCRKLQVVNALHGVRHVMTPGWYRIETRLAYRIGVARPPALVEAKGYHYRKGTALTTNLKSWVTNRLIPPGISYVRGGATGNGPRYEHLTVSRQGDVMLFSPMDNSVLTFFSQSERRDHLIRAHSILGNYLPVTKLEVTDDPMSLREEFVVGQSLHFASKETQYKVYKMLLRGFIKLAAEEAVPRRKGIAPRLLLEEALEITTGFPVNELIRKYQEPIEIVLAAAPAVPSHGDMVGQNVMAGPGGKFTIIDLEDFGYYPFFYNALRLPLANGQYQTGGSDVLLSGVLEGAFDAELNELFHAANASELHARETTILLLSVLVLQLRALTLERSVARDIVRNLATPFQRFASFFERGD